MGHVVFDWHHHRDQRSATEVCDRLVPGLNDTWDSLVLRLGPSWVSFTAHSPHLSHRAAQAGQVSPV
jgi:hypothetical protein